MNDKLKVYILTEDQKKLVNYFLELSRSRYSNFKTQKEIAADVGISRARANVSINYLIEKGMLEKTTVKLRSSYRIKG